MLPIQILVNNLLYDVSQTAIPTDNVDPDIVRRPRRWRIDDIRRYILYLGPVSSLFDYATFFFLLHVFGAWTNPALFQTGWFIESLLSQTLIVHVIRTDKIPLLQSRSSLALGLTTLAICALGIWLPFSPLAHAFGLVALPGPYWGITALVIFCYMATSSRPDRKSSETSPASAPGRPASRSGSKKKKTAKTGGASKTAPKKTTARQPATSASKTAQTPPVVPPEFPDAPVAPSAPPDAKIAGPAPRPDAAIATPQPEAGSEEAMAASRRYTARH